MLTTLDLLEKALESKKAYHWALELELQPSAITNARKRGRLSPTLAGRIATEVGEDPERWIAIAALEAEPHTPARDTLLKRLTGRIQKL